MSDSRSTSTGGAQNGKPDTYRCDFCGHAYWSELLLSTHRRLHTDEKRNYSCPLCSVSFGEPSQLEAHLQDVHKNEKRYECQYCGINFARTDALELHTLTYHIMEKKFRCKICNASFVKPIHLEQHSVIHKDKKEEKFDHSVESEPDNPKVLHDTGDVETVYSSQSWSSDSEQHVSGTKTRVIRKRVKQKSRDRHNNQSKKRPGTQGQFKPSHEASPRKRRAVRSVRTSNTSESNEERSNDSHSSSTTEESEREEVEEPNQKQTNVEDTVSDMGQGVSTKMKPCQVCGAVFRSFLGLIRHVCRNKTQVKIKSVPTKLPRSGSGNKHTYTKKHQLKNYEKSKPASQKINLASSARKTANASRHHENRTTAGKPTKAGKNRCRLCSKTFASAENMHVHYRMHSNERPYRCNICDLTFSQVSNFRTHFTRHKHLQSESPATVPYGCNICTNNFSKWESILHHLQTHRSRKSMGHECKICHLYFTYPQNFAKHQQGCSPSARNTPLESNQAGRETSGKDAANIDCPRCNQTFTSQVDRNLHILIVHCGNTDAGEVSASGQSTMANEDSRFNVTNIETRTQTPRAHRSSSAKTSKTDALYAEQSQNNDSPNHETELETYMCGYCDSHFLEMGQLVTHMQSHVAETE